MASGPDADLSTNTTDHLVGDIERLRIHLGIDRFVDLVPETERGGDLAAAYARLLASPDATLREEAARRWCAWEDTHMSLAPGYTPHLSVRELSFQLVFARLVTHYWAHGCFLADNEVMANLHRIAHIPAILIHGRHDVSGPLATAWELHRAWPVSRLVVVDDAGHFGGGMGQELVAAIDEIADQLGQQ